MENKPILYGSPISTCTNSVLAFFRAIKLDYEFKNIDMRAGEHMTEEFTKLNPLQKLPVLVEGDLILRESLVLSRYIANSRKIDDHWYPKDPKQRAFVDLAIEYWNQNIYKIFAYAHFSFGRSTQTKEEAKQTADTAFEDFEKLFLTKTKFVAGDKPSIADLNFLFYMHGQVLFSGYKPERKRIDEWVEDLKKEVPAIKDQLEDYTKAFSAAFQKK